MRGRKKESFKQALRAGFGLWRDRRESGLQYENRIRRHFVKARLKISKRLSGDSAHRPQ